MDTGSQRRLAAYRRIKAILWRKQQLEKNEAIRLKDTNTVEEKVARARSDAYLDAILLIEETLPRDYMVMEDLWPTNS